MGRGLEPVGPSRVEERNAAPPWNLAPITRNHLGEWLGRFEAPDAAELALFDPPL